MKNLPNKSIPYMCEVLDTCNQSFCLTVSLDLHNRFLVWLVGRPQRAKKVLSNKINEVEKSGPALKPHI